jgi:hypothetical protein
MKIIVYPASNKYYKHYLEEYFQNNRDQYFICICLDKNIQRHCNSFNSSNVEVIENPELSIVDQTNILNSYIDLIGCISIINSRSKIWWASDMASKNRLLSPVLPIIDNIVSVVHVINKYRHSSKNLYIIGASWPLITFLTQYAKTKGLKLYIKTSFFSRFFNQYKNILNKWILFIRSVGSSLLALLRTRMSFGWSNKIDRNKTIFLIKSYAFKGGFVNEKSYNDPFFGDLEKHLKSHLPDNSQIVTLLQGFSGRYQLYRKMRGLEKQTAVPVESFIYVRDIFLAGISLAWSWIYKPIKIPDKLPFLKYNLSDTMKKSAALTGGSVSFSDYLYYYIARRIARKYKLRVCYLTYEGNHWEKMFVMGLKDVDVNIEIIGCQHSTIPQSAAGVFISKQEVGIAPHPDKVVTTGKKATAILKKYSHFPESKIRTGCALRYQYLYHLDYQTLKQRKGKYVVLVALESAIEASKLLLYTIRQAELFGDIDFIVRAHPVFPIDKILNLIEIDHANLPKNIILSKLRHAVEDINRSDVILYWGSTISLEALAIGKPVISYNMGDVLSFDPLSLFNFQGLRWSLSGDTPIYSIISEILSLNDEEFLNRAHVGIQDIREYFNKETVESMKPFLPNNFSC